MIGVRDDTLCALGISPSGAMLVAGTAGSGRSYDDTTTTVLPVTITGATALTSPSSEDS